MREYAVVGSGIGGSSIAAYLSAKGHDVALFEKEPYLGGCSSSFYHKGFFYNTGATTFAGYQEGFVVKEIFDTIGFEPRLIKSEPAIVVVQNGKVTPRYSDFEQFLAAIQRNYPHPKNRDFWTLIQKINTQFYATSGHYYSNTNILSKLFSLTSYIPLGMKFFTYIKQDAQSFIKDFLDEIDEEYLQFLESQVLIVAQASLQEINFFTAALSLGYTFYDNYYVVGGLSSLFNDMTHNLKDLHRSTEIISIRKYPTHFELHSKDEVFEAKKLILNSTIYESGKLFENPEVQNYYQKYEKLNNYQSSFMLYFTLKSEKSFHHHYQIIEKIIFPNTLSRALFVSFSDKTDNEIAPEGYYSVTASIHTDIRYWEDKTTYKTQKEELQTLLLNTIIDILSLNKKDIVHSFAATPKSFARYIKRSQLGGNAITMENFLPKLPGNDTPIKNLYHVGDTVYAAQGWPGVMLGVKNLKKLLHV
jgi:phytoene dehydrogenase-like protein